MGQGFVYKCPECKFEAMVGLGLAMMFPSVYRTVLQDVKEGKYGRKWKRLSNQSEYIAIDATKKMYLCPKCGEWRAEYDLTLYEPQDDHVVFEMEFGDKTAAELGYVPYATKHDLITFYTELARFEHKCDSFKAIMLPLEEDALGDIGFDFGLKCPKCGAFGKATGGLLWD